MRIDRIDLTLVRLPLVRAFRTSSSRKSQIDHVLVRVEAGGAVGWGESASPSDPYYCPETSETCWHILKDFLAPAILGREWATIDDLVAFYAKVKGNNFAKSGLEMACWDLIGKAEGVSAARMLGGTAGSIVSGVSLGIEDDLPTLLGLVERYAGEGYRRVKLKIAPGWDVEVVRAVRRRFPDLPIQVDANSAYTLDDSDHLRRLDEFGLLLIEQPLAHDDIIDHARLQALMETPICLDESIHSADDARKALDLGPAGRSTSRSAASAGSARRDASTTSAWRAGSRPGAAGCTSSRSAAPPTWRSRASPASPSPATSRGRTSTIARTWSSPPCSRSTGRSRSRRMPAWA